MLHADDSKYELGHGLQVGTLPLYVGGYFSFEYEDVRHNSRSVKLDDIALMLYGEKERFSYMLELEANDIYTERLDGGPDDETVHSHLHIERMYLDYTFDEHYMIRAGKYNSLIGFWNPLPINVLRDTTSNPKITQMLFPDFTSGFDASYHSNNSVDLSVDVMLQATKDMDTLISHEVYNNFDTDRHYGIAISAQSAQWQFRLNFGYFRLVERAECYYLSGAFKYEAEKYRVQGEVGMQGDNDGVTIPYIGYLQALYEPLEGHELIVRAESYDDRVTRTKDTFGVFGYTYRPLYPVALKAEFQKHTFHDEDKVMLSLSVLF